MARGDGGCGGRAPVAHAQPDQQDQQQHLHQQQRVLVVRAGGLIVDGELAFDQHAALDGSPHFVASSGCVKGMPDRRRIDPQQTLVDLGNHERHAVALGLEARPELPATLHQHQLVAQHVAQPRLGIRDA